MLTRHVPTLDPETRRFALLSLRDLYQRSLAENDRDATRAIDLSMQALTEPLADHADLIDDWEHVCYCGECRGDE